MKKVKTNAQVTSMVCIIETAVVSLNWIAFGLIGFWILLFILYLVLLPYFFLMNTSHNKERVIEHGWKNVVGNSICIKWHFLSNLCDIIGNNDSVNKIHISNESSKNCEIKTNNFSEDNKKLKIISNSVLDDYPSTTKGQYITKQLNRPPSASDTNSDVSFDYKSGESIEVLISHMFKSIHDEKVYIQWLKLLIEHLSSSTDLEYMLDNRMKNEDLPNVVSDIRQQRRTTRCKGKQADHTLTKLNKCASFEMIINVDQLERPINWEHEVKERINRTTIRDTMLQEIYSNFGNVEKRNLLIEELIEEEETFLT